MPTKKKYISLTSEGIKSLAKEVGVSTTSVYNALNLNTHSDIAKKIRHLAISEYGGIEATKVIW